MGRSMLVGASDPLGERGAADGRDERGGHLFPAMVDRCGSPIAVAPSVSVVATTSCAASAP
eukprot:6012631-Pyramimonas_sp.AAC.1